MRKHILWIVIAALALIFIVLGIYLYKRSRGSQQGGQSTVHPLGTTYTTLPTGGPGPSVNG